jgi:uncharacterized protein YgiM (DUF1202 family)
MKNWQYIGTILTGIAALITAGVGLYEKLHTVQKEIYKAVAPQKTSREYGIVDDKDGWVNLRLEPNVEATIMAKILNGTNLEIIGKKGNWFKVSTESGRIGYVFSDRLILVNLN